MRKKTSILLGIGLWAVVLFSTLSPTSAAQEVSVGDSLTILLPFDALERSSIVVVTGRPKDAIAVGGCKTGEYRPQTVEIVDRTGESAPVTAEVIVIDLGYRNDPSPFYGLELAAGTRLGSFRGGGECGPGYAGYTAHVLAQ